MRRLSLVAVLMWVPLLTGCPNTGGNNSQFPPASYVTDSGATDAGPTDSGATDAGSPKDTGSTTKKDVTNSGGSLSCKGKCGASYNPALKCQCNSQCAKFGNCCADYGPLCEPTAASCKGRCDEGPNKGAVCQCDWSCGRYGSCCADFLATCHADKNLDMPLADAEEAKFCSKPANLQNVEYAKDGDTIELINGQVVRFLVVNTPELSKKDCHAVEALYWTKAMVKKVKTVCLIMDPAEGDKDQYDRLLRYVYYKDPAAGGKWVNMNLRLVRLGFGPVFYPYAGGQKWEKMGVLMQQKARQEKAGGWGVCGWK
ncbi:MAG: thermonuclease family protein [Myxococcales bacterium]|nr:thermonuclease family protein [Myxococcales bacterium]